VSVRGRRGLVSFDPEFFRKETASGRTRDARETFRLAHRTHHWRGVSRSGPGSDSVQTARIAAALPELCARLGVERMLDLPCGDFSWMAGVDLPGITYVGADIVPEVVAANVERYAGPGRSFLELDVVRSRLPAADLMLCRDCLVHLSLDDALSAVGNVARSDIHFLLATTFPAEPDNLDITTGDWRPLDLTKPPFAFPPPTELLNEGCTENGGAFADKSLGLWPVAALRT
jgi:SAM-dependent methyltransferase